MTAELRVHLALAMAGLFGTTPRLRDGRHRRNAALGSKIIVIPFDGAALDRDLQNASKATQPAASPPQSK